MRIDIVTLFPEMFEGPLTNSILKRAVEGGYLAFHFTNFRDYSFDKHRHVDDTPFGGGSGMVLKPEPLFRAVRSIEKELFDIPSSRRRILLMDPSGTPFSQQKAKELAEYEQLTFICGHYEGFDARVTDHLVDERLSIGDFVLTGGELPAMVMIDAMARMIPGVLGAEDSASTDSFFDGILGFPQYTRPREFENLSVPEILLSGDHAKIARWRRDEALRATFLNRPDLLDTAVLTDEDYKFLQKISNEND